MIFVSSGYNTNDDDANHLLHHASARMINRGYVVESEIHDGPYNYFPNWDYRRADVRI